MTCTLRYSGCTARAPWEVTLPTFGPEGSRPRVTVACLNCAMVVEQYGATKRHMEEPCIYDVARGLIELYSQTVTGDPGTG